MSLVFVIANALVGYMLPVSTMCWRVQNEREGEKAKGGVEGEEDAARKELMSSDPEKKKYTIQYSLCNSS